MSEERTPNEIAAQKLGFYQGIVVAALIPLVVVGFCTIFISKK